MLEASLDEEVGDERLMKNIRLYAYGRYISIPIYLIEQLNAFVADVQPVIHIVKREAYFSISVLTNREVIYG